MTESLSPPGAVAAGSAVLAQGLRRSFDGVPAVDGVDLAIVPGEVVALLGPNGAGKSTLIDMLLGLARPDAGSVALFGRTPRQAVVDGLVGAMLQTGGVPDDMTAGELVRLMAALQKPAGTRRSDPGPTGAWRNDLPGGRPGPMAAADALRAAGVEDIAGQRYGRLSGGQKQRVRFAAALVGAPDLLVLDEPTVAMDVTSRREFWAAMRRFTARGATVLFATHYLAEAEEFADRVVLLRSGRVVADDSVAAVRALATGRVVAADVEGATELAMLELPGVVRAEFAGPRVRLSCSDSDAALRALLAAHPHAHDIEVQAHGLEDAFVALTATEEGAPA